VGRVQNRQFGQFLRLLGVDDSQEGPKISEDIQLVYNVQDVSDLITPIPAVRTYHFTTTPVNAGRVSGLTIQPPSDSAIFLEWLRNDTGGGTSLQYRVGVEQVTNDIVTVVPLFTTGGTRRSVIIHGTRASWTAGVNLPDTESIPAQSGSLFCEPGFFVTFTAGPAVFNTAITVSFSYREIPLP